MNKELRMRTFFQVLFPLVIMFFIEGAVSLGLTWTFIKVSAFTDYKILSFWYFFTAMFIWLYAGIPRLLVHDGSTDVVRKIAGYTTCLAIVVGAAMLVTSVNFYTIVQVLFASVLIVFSFAQHEPMQLIRKRKE